MKQPLSATGVLTPRPLTQRAQGRLALFAVATAFAMSVIAACGPESVVETEAAPAPTSATTTVPLSTTSTTTTSIAAPATWDSIELSVPSTDVAASIAPTAQSATPATPPRVLPSTPRPAPTPSVQPTPPPSTTPVTVWQRRPASDIPVPELPPGWVVDTLGTTAQGRPIEVWARIPDRPTRVVVAVGAIHGNEPVSPPVVRSFVNVAVPDDVAVYLIPVANPDGVAAGSRPNGNDIDLNRNFPTAWAARDGGPAPASEAETQTLMGFIQAIRPTVVVWVHQPLGYVSSIGDTDGAYEQAWSEATGLPVRPDVVQHGGAETWTAAAGFASILVEVNSWDATPEMVAAQQNGFARLLSVLPVP